MTTIMSPVPRLACLLAGLLTGQTVMGGADELAAEGSTAAAATASAAYSPLPSGYSLSYDATAWNPEYSVFALSVADPVGILGSGFALSADPRLKPLTRLDTTWSVNSALLPLPLHLGDGVSSTELWDQPTRLGGVQIGTFQPPIPTVSAPPNVIALPYEGVSPIASRTPLYVDHLRAAMNVPPPSLEVEGQSDFSLESGRLRENFGLRSSDYGPWLTSGSYRYGLSMGTTVDGELAEGAGQQSFLGLGLLEGLGRFGLLSAGLDGSHDPDASGWLARVGYEYRQDRVSFAIRSHVQSAGYQELGDVSVIDTLRQRTLASAGVDLGSLGHFCVVSATQNSVDDGRRDLIAVSHALPLGSGIVSTAAAYSPGPTGSTALWLSITYPLTFAPNSALAHSTASTQYPAALDHTIIDAFGQTRLPSTARSIYDKTGAP